MQEIKRFLNSFSPRSYWFTILFLGLICCFLGLESRELFSGDETRVAGISAEMAREGNWIVPHLNDHPFLEYPPFYYWAQVLCFKLFGITDFAAKFSSAFFAFAGGMLVFLFARKLRFGSAAAFASSLILMTSAQYFGTGRTAMVDIVLATFTLTAVFGFYGTEDSEKKTTRFFYWLLFSFGIAGGIMTKGLIGCFMPCAIASAAIFLRDILTKKIHIFSYLRLGTGALTGLLPVAAWALLLYRQAGYEAFYEFAWVNNFGRFLGTQGDHNEAFYYYLLKLPSLFQPWLILLPFGIWAAFREIRNHRDFRFLYLLCFLLVPFLILCVSSSKRQVYLLPYYAPCALLCGIFLIRLLSGEYEYPYRERIEKYIGKYLFLLPFLLTAGITIAALVFLILASGTHWIYAVLGPVAMMIGLFCRKHKKRQIFFLLTGFVLFFSSVESTLFARENSEESLNPMFQYAAGKQKEGYKIYLIAPHERTSGAVYFYLDQNLPIRNPDEYDGISKELWIIRSRGSKTGKPYSDHHKIFLMPEMKTLWLQSQTAK